MLFQMFHSSPPVQIYAYRKKIKTKEYSCTCKTKPNFLAMPKYVAAVVSGATV